MSESATDAEGRLGDIALHFALLSLVAIGGGNAILPELQRFVVDLRHWMSDAEFAELFAIARASPGPNILIVTLLGWKAAGIAGAAVATAAISGPTSLMTFTIARLWRRLADAAWARAVERGLAAITLGLVAASGYVLTLAADRSWPAFAITAVTAAAVAGTRLNPFWLIGGAALIGAAGLL
jgi:chromate transporter